MPGLLSVSPGLVDDPTDLPRVSTEPVVPVRRALIDWAADRLNLGPVSSWPDMLGARTLDAPANPNQYPIVTGAGTDRRATFNGTNQRTGAVMNMTGPLTMVLVARIPTGAPSSYILTGTNTQQWNLGVNVQGRWVFNNGSGILLPPAQAADSDWHVFIVVVNGGSSVVSVDDYEHAGELAPTTWETMWIGASASTYYPVELRRFSVLPYAASTAERESIRQRLAAHYGI